MKKLKIEVTYNYEIDVEENNAVVKDYEDTTELVSDLVHYRFSDHLPVMKEGVSVRDIEVVNFKIV